MSTINPTWLEGRRRYWQRHDWPRFIRHDAHRFLTPAGIAEEKRVAEAEAAARREAEAASTAEQEAFELAVLDLRCEWKKLKLEYELQRIRHKYSPDQPRVPAGSSEGGQWTSGASNAGDAAAADSRSDGTRPDRGDAAQNGESLAQDRLPRTPASDQPPRSDRQQLEAIANDPLIRAYINEAWNASNPNGVAPQEHGFWISRDEVSGELFTRPFANRGFANVIVPGSPPPDAIALFHTHPYGGLVLGLAGPSPADENFARQVGLPGLIQSHVGMYYFGPSFRPRP